ncbi:LamG-like jellyroll fold domain-containing protein [Winogradskyella litorisediminis]|uniref:LamG-like jellyroll fold domain-containing protein n=1 Tax=Winogradskyella litorisediminis TaxID=1156618 RepID=A0ABW3N9H4_9FLAO
MKTYYSYLIRPLVLLLFFIFSNQILLSQTVVGDYTFTGTFDGWIDGGTYAGYGNNALYSCTNNGYIFLRYDYDLDTSSVLTSPTYNLQSYTNLDIDFCYHTLNIDNGDGFDLQYFDGTSWITIRTFTRGTDFTGDGGGVQNSATVSIDNSTYNFANNSQLRFRGQSNQADEYAIFDDVTVTASGCAAVNTFPYNEGFESGLGLWTQDGGDDRDWTRNSGVTPSNNTGPSGANEGLFYLFTEGSNPNFNSEFNLISTCFDLSSASVANFSFYYHMYGNNMGTLDVEVSTDGGSSWSAPVWTLSGEQQTSSIEAWRLATIDLSTYIGQTIKIRFSGNTGADFTSDMAIDNISLETSIPTGPEINIVGNSMNIVDGDTTPSVADGTDFGTTDNVTPINRTFTIQNLGTTDLILNSWSSSNSDFNITIPPALTTIPPGGSTNFTVSFLPSGAGNIGSTITIDNNDSVPEDIYTFSIQGVGDLPPPSYTYYFNTFESGNEGWNNITSTNDSWTRTNSFTTTDELGEGYFFRNTNYNSYSNNTNIVIESPVYNFSNVNNLKLSLDIKYNTENIEDGIKILYSVAGGPYSILGSTGDGTNWYSGNVTSLGSDGWSGDGHPTDPTFTGPHNQFVNASLNLPGSTFSNQSNVRFRIQFSSNGVNNFEGVAFDNFRIEGDPIGVLVGPTPPAPANVTSNLRLWLKANEGISTSDGSPLLLWEDQAYVSAAVDKEDATSGIGIAPTYRDNANRNINYNPVADFDNTTTNYMNGKGGLFSQDLFVVFRSDDTIENETGTFTPGRQFAIGARFAETDYHEDASGIAAGSSTARYDNEVLAFNISSFPNAATSGPNDTSYGRAYTSTTDTFSNHPIIVNIKTNPGATAAEIYKNGKKVDNTTGQAGNGTDLNFNELENLPYLIGTGRSGIAGRTTSQMNGMIAEIISYSSPNSAINKQKIQSYLALKYGVTLQDDASTLLDHRLNDENYIDSAGTIIWNTTDTDGSGNSYNYDVAGVGRDDASNLDQRQSRSQNDESDGTGPTSGFLTMGLSDIYDTNNVNLANTSAFSDRNFIMWGNNNASLDATPSTITVDMSADITGLNTDVSFIGMQRIWRVKETGDVGRMKIRIPESVVRNISPPGSYLMFISETGVFTPTAQYRVMTADGNGNLEADYDFPSNAVRYITFGYAPEIIVERSINFEPTAQNYIDVEDNLDLNSAFTLSTWIKRESDSRNKSIISKRDASYAQGYDLKILNSQRVEMSWKNGGTHRIQSAVVIPQNVWHHIAITHNGTTARLYIDGVLETTANLPLPADTDRSFLIGAAGRDGNSTAHFDGNIDEVRVWNTALTESQIRFLMNQELENNPGTIGKYFNASSILPTKNDASGLDFTNLRAYFPMSRYTYTNTNDESGNDLVGYLRQLRTVDFQTAPLPYISTQNGDWTSNNTWTNGNLQYIPGSRSIADSDITVNWNIVETSHDITIDNTDIFTVPDTDGNDTEGNRTVLAHVQTAGTITVNGDNTSKTGFGYTVTHYLEMSGKFDLEGESQLIQTLGSDLILGPSAELEKDQQGTVNTYHYNYWSSPVGETSIAPASINPNRHSYSVTDVMRDGTNAVNFSSSGYDGAATNPVTIADYWIWKFANNPDGDYSAWEHVRRTGNIEPGEGFTMKGPGTSTTEQNYTFLGKPNNADISLTISQYNDYLVGNPYASAIDARQFILDNGPTLAFNEGLIHIVLDEFDNPVNDSNGNPIYQTDGGSEYTMQVTGGGTPVNDANGNPIYLDGDDNPHYALLDSGGSPVLDSNGYIVYIVTGYSTEDDATTSGSLYFWEHWGGGDHILANYQGGYGTYNLSGSIAAPFSIVGTSDPDVSQSGSGTKAPGRYIPVGQGFFVVADNGGTINFNNGQRVFKKESATNGEFFRTTNTNNQPATVQTTDEADTRHKIKLGFESIAQQHRQLLLTIDEKATAGMDWGFDATTYDYKDDEMFWTIGNNWCVIQGAPSMDADVSYPLVIYTSEDGENTIKIDELINFEADENVYLHDIELNYYHNLREGDYEIFLNAGYYDTRFAIVFADQNQSLSTDDEILNENSLDVRYANNIDKVVLINPHGLDVKSIEVYNILGQSIITIDEIKTGNQTEYNVGTLSSGPYIIKLNTVSGSVSKKVLVN